MRLFRRLSSCMGVLLLAAGVLAAPASADPGDLTFRGCISGPANTGCHRHANGLWPRDIVVSPDGKSVYVASSKVSSGSDVATFHRNRSTGLLSPRGCIADANSNPAAARCSRTAPGLYHAASVAVSPDGRSVYVGGFQGTIAEFHRGVHGRLRFVDCAADEPRVPTEHQGDGCSLVRDGIGGDSLAVSPDGRFVYATSSTDSTVTELARDPSSGRLSFSGCAVASDVPTGQGYEEPTADCDLSSPALYYVQDVAVSPEGTDVYVVTGAEDFSGYGGRAILRLPRDPETGTIEAVNCLYGVLGEDCASVPYPPNGYSIALSPDGNSAYLSSACCQSPSSNALSRFDRDSGTGQLTYRGCIDANRLCSQHVNGIGFGDVVVSPDGRSVYVSVGINGLDTFRRRADGSLWSGRCLQGRHANTHSCDRTARMLPVELALSPDGRFLYGANPGVSIFRRNARFHKP